MRFKNILNKKGSQMVEAAISLPLIILAAMLMIRLFVFYLDILTTSINEHRKALETQDSYKGAVMRTYEEEAGVDLLKGGILSRDVSKKIKVKAYLINEDMLVRSGEILD